MTAVLLYSDDGTFLAKSYSPDRDRILIDEVTNSPFFVDFAAIPLLKKNLSCFVVQGDLRRDVYIEDFHVLAPGAGYSRLYLIFFVKLREVLQERFSRIGALV